MCAKGVRGRESLLWDVMKVLKGILVTEKKGYCVLLKRRMLIFTTLRAPHLLHFVHMVMSIKWRM